MNQPRFNSITLAVEKETPKRECLSTAKCQHLEAGTKILGRKKQYVVTICKNCGLLLEFEEKCKVNA